MTLPEATVALLPDVTVPRPSPAAAIAVPAAADVMPTTFGTITCAGGEPPLEPPPHPASKSKLRLSAT